jgi:hypothetical protein
MTLAKVAAVTGVWLASVGAAPAQLIHRRAPAPHPLPPPGVIISGPVVVPGVMPAGPFPPPGMVIYSAPVYPVGQDCCPCPPGSSGNCKDDCKSSYPFKIVPRPENCPTTRTCTPINVTTLPLDKTDCKDIPFYGKPVAFKKPLKVPTLVEECREEIRFKDVTVSFFCCEITVCVQCEKCYVKTKRCVEVEKEVAIEAYRRQDQSIDVYGQDVPGLPKQFVLQLKMKEADFKAAYPNAPLPTYP